MKNFDYIEQLHSEIDFLDNQLFKEAVRNYLIEIDEQKQIKETKNIIILCGLIIMFFLTYLII